MMVTDSLPGSPGVEEPEAAGPAEAMMVRVGYFKGRDCMMLSSFNVGIQI